MKSVQANSRISERMCCHGVMYSIDTVHHRVELSSDCMPMFWPSARSSDINPVSCWFTALSEEPAAWPACRPGLQQPRTAAAQPDSHHKYQTKNRSQKSGICQFGSFYQPYRENDEVTTIYCERMTFLDPRATVLNPPGCVLIRAVLLTSPTASVRKHNL